MRGEQTHCHGRMRTSALISQVTRFASIALAVSVISTLSCTYSTTHPEAVLFVEVASDSGDELVEAFSELSVAQGLKVHDQSRSYQSGTEIILVEAITKNDQPALKLMKAIKVQQYSIAVYENEQLEWTQLLEECEEWLRLEIPETKFNLQLYDEG